MLNAKKISVYRKYGGDIDGFVRLGTPQERSAISDDEWFLIDSFVQKLSLVKKGVTSAQYTREIYDEIQRAAESDNVLQELKRFA